MAFLPPNNALAWAHFRLRGGWARSLKFAGGMMALLVILIVSSAQLSAGSTGVTLFGWVSGMLMLQAGVLAIYATGRLRASIRQDVRSQLIESHRLMPMPASDAIAGYIIGAVAPALVLAGGIFLVGGATSVWAGVALARWTFANAILLAFCAFLWTFFAYTAFGAKLGAAFFIFVMPQMSGGLFILLPGLSVLLSPMIGRSIFSLRDSGANLPATYAMALAAQAYLGTVFFLAAVRKYRCADAIGMDSVLGLFLLLGWVAVSMAGMREWPDFRSRYFPAGDMPPMGQLIASMGAGILFAIPAISAHAMEHVIWLRHERLHDPAPLRRPLPLVLVIVAATILILLIPLVPHTGQAANANLMIRSGACVAIALLGLYMLFRLCYFASTNAGIPAFVWMLVTWGGPIAIDAIRFGLADYGESEPIAGFSTCSPIGCLIVLWKGSVINATPGICVQAAIAAIPGLLLLMSRVRTRNSD